MARILVESLRLILRLSLLKTLLSARRAVLIRLRKWVLAKSTVVILKSAHPCLSVVRHGCVLVTVKDID